MATKPVTNRIESIEVQPIGPQQDFPLHNIPDSLSFLSDLTKDEILAKLHHSSSALTNSEKEFLRRWQSDLPLGKWGEFLISWARALGAYDTPPSIIDSVSYKFVEFEFSGQPYPFILRSGGNYMQRRTLMKKQKHYLPKLPLHAYGYRLDPASCLLCQNVTQAVDVKNVPELKDNAILDLGPYLLLPNRYPAQAGASLFMSKNHDSIDSRVIPDEGELGKPRRCPIEEGKTRNRLLPAVDLYWLMAVSDALDLVAVRNHVLSGMSIPFHDHFHVFPADLPSTLYFKNLLQQCRQTAPFREIFVPEHLPFSVLTIRSNNLKRLAFLTSSVLKKLELDNQVYGLVYYKNHIFITPRNKDAVDEYNVPLGGGSVLLFENDVSSINFAELAEKYVPLQGQFNWEPYLS